MSPCGCRSERSTLARRPPPRDVNRAGLAPPDQDRNRPRRFRTNTISDQDAFRWFDLPPCGRNRLTRALFYDRPRSPRTLLTHCESALLVKETSRRMRLPRSRLHTPFGALRGDGEDASTQRLQPTHDTSTLRIARLSNHRRPWLSPGRRLPRLQGGANRVEPRLTTSLQLR